MWAGSGGLKWARGGAGRGGAGRGGVGVATRPGNVPKVEVHPIISRSSYVIIHLIPPPW